MLRCLTDNVMLTKIQVPAELLRGQRKPDTEVLKCQHFSSCSQYVNWWPFWDGSYIWNEFMHCDLALHIVMFKMQMNQDVDDGEGQRDWNAHGEPSFKRSLKCFFTSAEYVIGMSVECFPNADIVRRNLVAYAWMGRFLRPTANLRYRHHPLETRAGYPPTTEMLCSADHSNGRTSLSLLWTCLEPGSQGWVTTEMEAKPLNLPSLRSRQCPGEEFLAGWYRRRYNKCPHK